MDLQQALPCTLRQIQYLVAVADAGGFRKAADLCHVSQPSLSAQVSIAEKVLGVQVFERDRRRVRISRDGAAVLDQARRVLIAARDLDRLARQLANPLTGTLRIGVIPTVCPYLLPEIAPALQRAYPDLALVWSEDKTAELVRRIAAGTVDGALVALGSDLRGLEHVEIGRDPFVLAAAPGHRLVQSTQPANPRVLEGQPVLLLEDGHCLRDQVLSLCAPTGAVDAGLRATSLATLVQMVSVSAGVTLLPALALPVENRRGQLRTRAFAAPGPSRTLVLSWRRGTALRPALEAVARTIRSVYHTGIPAETAVREPPI